MINKLCCITHNVKLRVGPTNQGAASISCVTTQSVVVGVCDLAEPTVHGHHRLQRQCRSSLMLHCNSLGRQCRPCRQGLPTRNPPAAATLPADKGELLAQGLGRVRAVPTTPPSFSHSWLCCPTQFLVSSKKAVFEPFLCSYARLGGRHTLRPLVRFFQHGRMEGPAQAHESGMAACVMSCAVPETPCCGIPMRSSAGRACRWL